MASSHEHEVLVVGGGPAGASAAYWLAHEGHDVAIVEKQAFPRAKNCGDSLTPRAVRQLQDMGLAEPSDSFHLTEGLRLVAHGRAMELAWPSRRDLPPFGAVVRRSTLDALLAANAASAGAVLLEGHEALAPVLERGFVRGAVVRRAGSDGPTEVRARYVLVADGANSRFGRTLGTFRTREWPYGAAIRAYFESPRHAEPWIESVLDLTDRDDHSLPGYGWVAPVGDGTVNVGVGLLSTFRDFKSVNTNHLLDQFARSVAERWGLDPDRPTEPPAAGRVPMGGSVGPKAGPTYLVVGDAAGSVNPFNGEGVDYALETGRLAAGVLHDALAANDPTTLQQYSALLEAQYGQYFKVARLFARAIGRPSLMRGLTRAGLHSRSLMESAVRISANLLRPDALGPAELTYRAASALVRLAPNA